MKDISYVSGPRYVLVVKGGKTSLTLAYKSGRWGVSAFLRGGCWGGGEVGLGRGGAGGVWYFHSRIHLFGVQSIFVPTKSSAFLVLCILHKASRVSAAISRWEKKTRRSRGRTRAGVAYGREGGGEQLLSVGDRTASGGRKKEFRREPSERTRAKGGKRGIGSGGGKG